MWLLQPLHAEAGDLGRYCGYHLEYTSCMSVPGNILLSLVHLYEEDGMFLLERRGHQEHTSSTDVQAEEWAHYHYFGAALQLQDRMFLTNYESLTLNKMSQAVLIPSLRNRTAHLNDLKMGVPGGDRRTPAYGRVI